MALHFDEVDQHATVADSATLTLPAAFTLSQWVRFDDNVGSLYQYFFSQGTILSTSPAVNFLHNEVSSGYTGLRVVIRNDGGVSFDHSTSTFLASDVWHHITVVSDGSGSAGALKLYINGVLEASSSGGWTSQCNPSGSLTLAARQDLNSSRRLGGSMADIAKWDAALSLAQIEDLADPAGAVRARDIATSRAYLYEFGGDGAEYSGGTPATLVNAPTEDLGGPFGWEGGPSAARVSTALGYAVVQGSKQRVSTALGYAVVQGSTQRISTALGCAVIKLPETPNRPTIAAVDPDIYAVELTGSAYSHPEDAEHGASRWQASTNALFSTTAYDGTDEYPAEGAPATPGHSALGLSAATLYYFRVQYRDVDGNWGPWSLTASATTDAASPITTPSVTVDPSYDQALLTGSALVDPEDPDRTHVMSEWEVQEPFAGSPRFQSLEDTANLTSILATGLEPSTDYNARVRYRVADGTWSAWSTDVLFDTTAAGIVPATPTASVQSQTSGSLTLAGTAFSYPEEPGETHAETLVQVSASGTFASGVFQQSFTPGQVVDLLVEGLSQNTLYYYRIRYRASDGTWSAWSATLSTTTNEGVFAAGVFLRPYAPRFGAVVRGAAVQIAWVPASEIGATFEIEVSPDGDAHVWSVVASPSSSPYSWDTTGLSDGVHLLRIRAVRGEEVTAWEYRPVVVDNAESPTTYTAHYENVMLAEDFTPMWNTDGHTWDFSTGAVVDRGSNLSDNGWAALAYDVPLDPRAADVMVEVLNASTGGSFPWSWFPEQSWAGVGISALNHADRPFDAGLGVFAAFYAIPIQSWGDCFHSARGDGFLNIKVKDSVANPNAEALAVSVPLGKIHFTKLFGGCEKIPRYGVRLRVTTVEDHPEGDRTIRIQAAVYGMEIDNDAVGPWHYDDTFRTTIECGRTCLVSREITTSRAYRSFSSLTVVPTSYGTCDAPPEWDEPGTVSETAELAERAWAFVLDGHVFYVLNFSDRPALVCDLTTGQWHSWFTRTFNPAALSLGSGIWNMFRGIMWKGRVIAADFSDPIVWELDPHSMLDESVDVIQRAVTAFQPLRGSASARQGSMRLTARKEDLGASSTIRMRFSDDGGRTWSTWRSVILAASSYSKKIEWRSLGRIRAPGRLWEIDDAGGLVRIEGSDADLEGG